MGNCGNAETETRSGKGLGREYCTAKMRLKNCRSLSVTARDPESNSIACLVVLSNLFASDREYAQFTYITNTLSGSACKMDLVLLRRSLCQIAGNDWNLRLQGHGLEGILATQVDLERKVESSGWGLGGGSP